MKSTIGKPRARGRSRRTTVAAATAAMALIATACGGPGGGGGGGGGDGEAVDVPGVTEDTITIGTTQPLTGPAAPGYAPIAGAMRAYYDYVNDNGGIHGREINLIVEDDAYNPTQTLEKTRKLVQQDNVFAMVGALGTPTHSTALDFLNENGVPDLMVSSGSLSWNQPEQYPYTFGWQLDYVREGKILATYAEQEFGGDDVTYCSFGQSDDLGGDGVRGVELILGDDALSAKEGYSATNQNVAPQIGSLQAAGCDVVFGFMIPGFTALALGTAAQLGFSAQWVISSVGADPVALEGYLGDNAEALTEGLVGVSYMPLLTDTDNPWVPLFIGIHEEYNGEARLDMTTLHGYMMAYAGAQAIAAAGENPTRESIIEAMHAGIDRGPSPTPYAFAPDNHAGQTGAFVTAIESLEPVRKSPTWVTDTEDGPVEEFNEGPTEVVNNGVPQ